MDAKEIELQALITEREGMIAVNKQRERNDLAPGYDELSFFQLAEQIRKLKE